MRGLEVVSLLAVLCLAPALAQVDRCLEPDAVQPECDKWVDPVEGIPIFFEHQFNCSRFWVCNPDLSDCLHECAPADNEGNALYFDFSIKYPDGPTCNWPFEVNCTNKENTCKQCKPSEQCILCEDCPDCPEPCLDGGIKCVCKEGSSCINNNSRPCGTCTNHVCIEPECCTDEDCNGAKCIDGKCGECVVNADCTEMACSTCESGSCNNPECCTDDDCANNEYCTDAQECVIGCRENSDCINGNHLPCSECKANSCTDPECCVDDDCSTDQYCDYNTCMDGCNEDSDCMDGNHLSCAKCQDNSCTNPECCVDDDCASDQYCDNNTCVDGCNEDSDCVDCAECGADHQCTTPECCASSDCSANHLSCAECQSDNTCTDPECCIDTDCPSNLPICENNVCIPECKVDSECPKYDGICGDDDSYTEDDSECFYCTADDENDNGSCEPGCVDNDNCDGSMQCNGEHRCKEPGSFVALESIEIETTSCSGCSGSNVEGGAVLYLKGKDGANDFKPECTTAGLDHTNRVDYSAGGSSIFDNENDQTLLDGCFLVNLLSEVKSGSITWTGEGQLTVSKITFCWSDSNAICSKCTVSGPVSQNQTLPMTCM